MSNSRNNKTGYGFLIRLAAVSLCASLICSGCSYVGAVKDKAESYVESYAEQSESETVADLTQDQITKQREEFAKLCSETFAEDLSYSLLNMHFIVRDPEAMGITDYKVSYGDFSFDQLVQDGKDRDELYEQLKTIDVGALEQEDQLTYKTMVDYLETEKLSDRMELYYEPLMPTIGIQANLPILMAEYQFYDKEDVDEYLTLLESTDEYFEQIVEFEKLKSEAGLFMNDHILDDVLESCDVYTLKPGDNFLSDTFAERLDTVSGVTQEEKDSYIQRDEDAINKDFNAAYKLLRDGLEELRSTGTNENGLAGYNQGKEYCEYLIKSGTGTSYTDMDKLTDDIEAYMNDAYAQMGQAIADGADYDMVLDYKYPSTDPREMIGYLQDSMGDAYPDMPEYDYVVKDVPKSLEGLLSPAFYIIPCIDDYTKNTIYIDESQAGEEDLLPTLAHEGVPGHMLQNVYYTSKQHDPIRSLLACSGYAEGWATYVEYRSYAYDENLTDTEAKLLSANAKATLGLYAYLDMRINYYNDSRDKVQKYLNKYYELDEGVADMMYNYISGTPCNYLNYYVGMMEIEQMRAQAEEKLGDRFDEKEFNTMLLDMGETTFRVIRPYFSAWLMGK